MACRDCLRAVKNKIKKMPIYKKRSLSIELLKRTKAKMDLKFNVTHTRTHRFQNLAINIWMHWAIPYFNHAEGRGGRTFPEDEYRF